MASNVVKCSADGETPIPSIFTRDDYTMAGMGNSVYEDNISLASRMGSQCVALELFQDATLNKPLNKPLVSRRGLGYTDPILRK